MGRKGGSWHWSVWGKRGLRDFWRVSIGTQTVDCWWTESWLLRKWEEHLVFSPPVPPLLNARECSKCWGGSGPNTWASQRKRDSAQQVRTVNFSSRTTVHSKNSLTPRRCPSQTWSWKSRLLARWRLLSSNRVKKLSLSTYNCPIITIRSPDSRSSNEFYLSRYFCTTQGLWLIRLLVGV